MCPKNKSNQKQKRRNKRKRKKNRHENGKKEKWMVFFYIYELSFAILLLDCLLFSNSYWYILNIVHHRSDRVLCMFRITQYREPYSTFSWSNNLKIHIHPSDNPYYICGMMGCWFFMPHQHKHPFYFVQSYFISKWKLNSVNYFSFLLLLNFDFYLTTETVWIAIDHFNGAKDLLNCKVMGDSIYFIFRLNSLAGNDNPKAEISIK